MPPLLSNHRITPLSSALPRRTDESYDPTDPPRFLLARSWLPAREGRKRYQVQEVLTMYSVVLMMAMTTGAETPDLGRRGGCCGCSGSPRQYPPGPGRHLGGSEQPFQRPHRQ